MWKSKREVSVECASENILCPEYSPFLLLLSFVGQRLLFITELSSFLGVTVELPRYWWIGGYSVRPVKSYACCLFDPWLIGFTTLLRKIFGFSNLTRVLNWLCLGSGNELYSLIVWFIQLMSSPLMKAKCVLIEILPSKKFPHSASWSYYGIQNILYEHSINTHFLISLGS